MNYKINKLGQNLVEIEILASWKRYEETAIQKVKAEAEVAGFRKGKVPEDILRIKFKNMIGNEILDLAIAEYYPQIIEKEGLDVLSQPVLTSVDLSGEDLKIKMKASLFPTVKLGKYKGVKVSRPEVEVSEEHLQNALNYLAGKNAKVQESAELSKLGDLLVIDFKGYIDGKPFPGGSHDDYQLRLGSKSFIDNFEEQLVGYKAGEEVNVEVTFPAEYPEESLRGKKATFKVTVKEVKSVSLPEIDDELAKSEGFETLDKLKEFVNKKLSERRAREAEEKVFNELVEKIAASSDLEVPEELVKRELEEKNAKFKEKEGREANDAEAKIIRSNVISELREMLVIREILKKEDINIQEEEVKKHVEENFNMRYSDVISSDKHTRFLNEIESNLRINKLKEFMLKNNP